MPGFLTDYINNAVLEHFFGGVPLPPPPEKLYFGLSQTIARKSGYVMEPAAPSYARVPVDNNGSLFSPATCGEKHSFNPVKFGEVKEDWGMIRCIFIADAPTGGNVLAMTTLSDPENVEAGDKPPVIVDISLAHR
jgi:hypothetical protein